jgi:hypothetical protein
MGLSEWPSGGIWLLKTVSSSRDAPVQRAGLVFHIVCLSVTHRTLAIILRRRTPLRESFRSFVGNSQ